MSKKQDKLLEKLKTLCTKNLNGDDSGGKMGGGGNNGDRRDSLSPQDDDFADDKVSNLSKMTAQRMKFVDVKGKKVKNSYNPTKLPAKVEVKKRGSILTDKEELDGHKLIEHVLDGSPSPTKVSKEDTKLYMNQEPNQGRFPSSIDNKTEFA